MAGPHGVSAVRMSGAGARTGSDRPEGRAEVPSRAATEAGGQKRRDARRPHSAARRFTEALAQCLGPGSEAEASAAPRVSASGGEVPVAGARAAGHAGGVEAAARALKWAAEIAALAAKARSEAVLHVNDPVLGALEVTVRRRKRAVEVRASGDAKGCWALARERERLAADLAARGLVLVAFLARGSTSGDA
ncbi:MAG: hypothetical protein D6729_16240 [Deltaproteobacteria bacterium]|nr:MAG: hypothetical protein D6729_16240 [Deltaproteobacteria bacterium]